MQAKTLFSTSPRGMRLFAAALLLALTGAFVAVAQAQTPGTPQVPPMHGFAHGGPGGGRMVERMLDSVNATADQRSPDQADHRVGRGRHEGAATRPRRGAARARRQLFAQPTVDATAVEAVRQQMLQQHDQASRRMDADDARRQRGADARAAHAAGRSHGPTPRHDAAPPCRSAVARRRTPRVELLRNRPCAPAGTVSRCPAGPHFAPTAEPPMAQCNACC